MLEFSSIFQSINKRLPDLHHCDPDQVDTKYDRCFGFTLIHKISVCVALMRIKVEICGIMVQVNIKHINKENNTAAF